MSEAKAVLRYAQALIADKENWIQFTAAKNANGKAVSPEDKGAKKFCLSGAVEKAVRMRRAGNDVRNDAFTALGNRIAAISLNDNSSTTHEDVLKALDEAIKNA